MKHSRIQHFTCLACLFFVVITAPQFAFAQYGQLRVPVFKSKADSVKLIELQELIDSELSQKKVKQQRIDSLMFLQQRIYEKSVVFKNIYRPSQGYIVTDSLEKMEDLSAVTTLCIYRKNTIPDVVWQCKNVESIEFVNTTITRLPAKLRTLKKLKSIYIYRNMIDRPLRLSKNKSISILSILNEQPDGLPVSYRKFKALIKLDLAENEITRFPNGARRNKKLTELSLQRNLITLTGPIKPHPYLERLALHGNQIEVVPAAIGNFKNLKKLNLNLNKISSVNDALGKLTKLEQLSFYGNELAAIPPAAYKLLALKEIDLFHNQIDQIDPDFCRWQNLTTLYLSFNKLVALPENIDTLKHLEGLYAWDNRIGELPSSVGNLKELKYIRVNRNYIKKIPPSLLLLDKLEEIDLSHNYISELPKEIFDFPHLKILALAGNPWDEKSWAFIPKRAKELREKDVFVHLADDTEENQ